MYNEFFQKFSLIEPDSISKIKISGKNELVGKPLKDGIFCFERIIEKQAFHENIDFKNLCEFLFSYLSQKNTNITVICFDTSSFSFKLSKNGKLLFNKSVITQKKSIPQEKFVLPLDIPVFKRLGLVSSEGKLIDKMRGKYEQISRFCELISLDILKRDKINIVDLGCGKAYLSFALYHFLSFYKNIDVKIHGVDLKSGVINELIKLSQDYGYKGMTFSDNDIKKIDLSGFDMMISLHACDKATDFALFNAIKGNIDTILCVPCCQQEMNKTLRSENFPIFSRYGLIKERISALLTDAIRASLLTANGYKVNIIEIVDFEHSPKNIMIKAKKGNVSVATRKAAFKEAEAILREFGSTCELFTLLVQNGEA